MKAKTTVLGLIGLLGGSTGCIAGMSNMPTQEVKQERPQSREEALNGALLDCIKLYGKSIGMADTDTDSMCEFPQEEDLEGYRKVSKPDPNIYREAPQICHDAVEVVMIQKLTRQYTLLRTSFSDAQTIMYGKWTVESGNMFLEDLEKVMRDLDMATVDASNGREITIPEEPEFRETPSMEAACQTSVAEYIKGIETYETKLDEGLGTVEERVPQLATSRGYQGIKKLVFDEIENQRKLATNHDCSENS